MNQSYKKKNNPAVVWYLVIIFICTFGLGVLEKIFGTGQFYHICLIVPAVLIVLGAVLYFLVFRNEYSKVFEWGLVHMTLIYFGFNYRNENPGAPWSNMACMMLTCMVLGILFSYVTLKTGNCMYAAIMHGVVNIIGEIPVFCSTKFILKICSKKGNLRKRGFTYYAQSNRGIHPKQETENHRGSLYAMFEKNSKYSDHAGHH